MDHYHPLPPVNGRAPACWALGIANALTFDRTQLRVLSLFVPIPVMWSFGKILRDHRTTILHSIKATPVFVREGVQCFA
ncbi:hypothetical protein FA13DRAFT_313809 [Coprinellus micaceus]|uniref:Uncharacterized protein n=1 Tax=Coprinellus micaceus TaxID=71717 RepID=A0A4Y7TCJ2_COPMI|nr:hypothetical protein FA13DRAFT_313809 [Coprinellus micaceus]